MLKFSFYVLLAYAIYYGAAIALEFFKSPNIKRVKESQSFTVAGAEKEEPTIVGDVKLSEDASNALEKKNN